MIEIKGYFHPAGSWTGKGCSKKGCPVLWLLEVDWAYPPLGDGGGFLARAEAIACLDNVMV